MLSAAQLECRLAIVSQAIKASPAEVACVIRAYRLRVRPLRMRDSMCAGVSRIGPLVEQPLSDMEELFNTNIMGVLRVSQVSGRAA